jgi:hypothetical protein
VNKKLIRRALRWLRFLRAGRGRQQQQMTVENGLGDVDKFLPAVARVIAQHGEGLPFVDPVALHENALGALGLRAAPEGALQVVVFREAAQRDVERALQLLGRAVHDVGEDAALSGFVDERRVVALQHRDHRALRLADDALDQLQRVR